MFERDRGRADRAAARGLPCADGLRRADLPLYGNDRRRAGRSIGLYRGGAARPARGRGRAMKRLVPFPLLTAALFVMWVLLTGFSPGPLLLGAVVALLVSRVTPGSEGRRVGQEWVE